MRIEPFRNNFPTDPASHSASTPALAHSGTGAPPPDQKSSADQEKEVAQAAEKIAKFVAASTSGLRFSVDKDSNQIVVKVIDQQTQQVIRQLPSADALELSKALDQLSGLLVKNSA